MEIIKHDLKFKFMTPRLLTMINKIIIHHSDWENCTVEDIHRSHLNRGFAGIGYNYVIYPNGTVHKARPERYVGAHCTGQNSTSIGICLVGDFTKHDPTQEQINSLVEFVNQVKTAYPSIKRVGLHREFQATACPVYNFLKHL